MLSFKRNVEGLRPQISHDAIAAFEYLEWYTRFMSHKKLKDLDLDRFIGLQNPRVYVSRPRIGLQSQVIWNIYSRLNYKRRSPRSVRSMHKTSMKLGFLLDEADLST